MGKTTTKRRSRYTDEEIAEFRAADEALFEQSQADLDDPDTISTVIAQTLQVKTPRIFGYSLRNLALIAAQARNRGIALTDVDTKVEWRKRGRKPSQLGLRLLAPRKKKDESEDGERLDGFTMVSVFDISMTVPIEGQTEMDVEPVADPAGALWASLLEQAQSLGLEVLEDDDEAAHGIGEHTVTVAAGRPVEQLARLLAPRSAAQTRERAAGGGRSWSATPPAGAPLDLGEYGTAYATDHVDEDTGRVFYRVTGARVSGTFTLWIPDALQYPEARVVNVTYGENRRDRWGMSSHDDRPTVNGVALLGGSQGHHLDAAERIGYDNVAVRCEGGSARRPTAERAAAVVRALVLLYRDRTDHADLQRGAVALAAKDAQDAAAAEARRIQDQIDDLMRRQEKLLEDQHDALARASHYEYVADEVSEPAGIEPDQVA